MNVAVLDHDRPDTQVLFKGQPWLSDHVLAALEPVNHQTRLRVEGPSCVMSLNSSTLYHFSLQHLFDYFFILI